jgi:Holliday junction DNA helicase RuvB
MNPIEFFKHIVGQTAAIRQLVQAIKSSINGGKLISPLFLAPAGTGKTYLAQGYANALKSVFGLPVLFTSVAKIRKLGENWTELLTFLGQDGYVLFLDEIHELWQKPTAQNAKIIEFLRAAMDGNFRGGEVEIGDGFTLNFDRRTCAIMGATNYPGVMSEAVRSRFERVELDLYSEDELIAIIKMMLEREGLKACDESLRIAAKCGRGTARVPEKMVEKMVTNLMADGWKSTINKSEIFQALVDSKYFPLGFDQSELETLCAMKNPASTSTLLAGNKKMDKDTLRDLIGYTLGLGMIAKVSGGFTLTDKGRRYFVDCGKEKFPVPAL